MSRIVPDPERFFSSVVPSSDGVLRRLEQEAAAEGIPIVGPVVGRLLSLLAGTTGARRVLELGTASGYSAIFLARGCSCAPGAVTTVEHDPEMARRAGANIREAGCADAVEVLQGSAGEVLPRLAPPFDLAFLDIDKEGYLAALPQCRRLLRPRGLLVADNTAFPAASDFVRALSGSGDWEAVHLFSYLPGHSPEHDAVTLALRR